ncbi:MAG: cyclomaltodextrinase N-terminal domain-containing protein, partial [Dysgonamonadaceae bacterium]|nr:cyclomaltodextrinase N-terminal domain-containing protein [Dysgonamonadaceae bacterium]
MKKLFFIIALFVFSLSATAVEITRMEPAFWWVGMKNPELQILVQGKNIAQSQVQLDYPDVRIKDIVKPENPNYLFIYLEIGEAAQPGQMELLFTEGKEAGTLRATPIQYELKPRATTIGAQGFNTSDVMYLIMPDRFANADPSNDVWEGVLIEREDPFGRHGGDLAGIEAHLDYLDNLGITAIWLNPVLENKMPDGSYHGYAITDFYQVDKRFGSNEDYCRLIEKAHQKGIKMVMDMIYNHCGSNHWWIGNFPTNDWLNHQDGFVPTTHNLYTIMDPHAPQSEIAAMTDGWFVPSMPDLNQRNQLLADYLIQNSIWWIEYA